MRYFLFIDESGEASIVNRDPRFNIFVLCGILFREDHYKLFNDAMKQLKADVFGNPDIVFHSFDMRKQQGEFSVLKDKDLQALFYKRIGEIFTDHEYTILACVVDKEAYKTKYPEKNQAYEDALKFICERSISKIGRRSTGNTIHVCLEKRQKSKDSALKKYFTSFRKYGTDYYSTAEFEMFAEILSFRGKNQKVNGLEFADLCAYPIARISLHPEIPQPTFEIFKPKICCDYRGKIDGIGIKRFP